MELNKDILSLVTHQQGQITGYFKKAMILMISMMTGIPWVSGISGFLTVGTFFTGTTFFAISGTLKILVAFNNINLQDAICTH